MEVGPGQHLPHPMPAAVADHPDRGRVAGGRHVHRCQGPGVGQPAGQLLRTPPHAHRLGHMREHRDMAAGTGRGPVPNG